MKFIPTDVDGCYVVELEPHGDNRGFFARTFCVEEFEHHGLDTSVVQCNMSFNLKAGTLRGMHRQVAPYAEAKLVRCTRGSVIDCALDLREDSPTFGRSVQVELSADNRLALFIPPYVAHGYLTLEDSSEVIYQVSGPYAPQGEQGQRHDDPAFGLSWPRAVEVISDKDASWPNWNGRPIG
ncbi:MAG: dTDP-4-dehydrorhamnose 3,5-epimerase [Dermatophilaceae bacterium]